MAVLFLVALSALLLAAPASAQFQQYVPPGEFEEERETMKVRLDRATKESRWRAGRFFLDPWLALRNISFVDNSGGISGADVQSDFTATLGAGLRLYRPIGAEMTFAAHALPEYVWWQDLSARRRVNGRYGAGLFGNFGRAGLQVAATRSEDALFFSREVETPVNTRYDKGVADVEVSLGAGISLFVGGEKRRIRFLDQDDPVLAGLALLDRDEDLLRAGLRFTASSSLSIGVGVEESAAEFESGQRDRSNSGTSTILQLEFRGTRFDLTANLAARDLEPEPGSSFVPFDEITGKAQLQFRFGGRLRPQLYANRNLVYSIDPGWTYFEDTSVGLGLRTSLGGLASLRLFVEKGTNDYTALTTGLVDRQDDLDVFGGDVRLNFGRYSIQIGATRTRYDSSTPGFDRDVTVIRSGIGLGAGGGSPWG